MTRSAPSGNRSCSAQSSLSPANTPIDARPVRQACRKRRAQNMRARQPRLTNDPQSLAPPPPNPVAHHSTQPRRKLHRRRCCNTHRRKARRRPPLNRRCMNQIGTHADDDGVLRALEQNPRKLGTIRRQNIVRPFQPDCRGPGHQRLEHRNPCDQRQRRRGRVARPQHDQPTRIKIADGRHPVTPPIAPAPRFAGRRSASRPSTASPRTAAASKSLLVDPVSATWRMLRTAPLRPPPPASRWAR